MGKRQRVGAALFFLFLINKGDIDAGKDRAWVSALKISSVGIKMESLSNKAVSSVPYTKFSFLLTGSRLGYMHLKQSDVMCDVHKLLVVLRPLNGHHLKGRKRFSLEHWLPSQ